MSDSSDYQTSGYYREAGTALKEELGRRGIFFHDVKAWANARERTEEMHQRLQEELRRRCISCSLSDAIQGGGAGDMPSSELAKAEAMLEAFKRVPIFREAALQLKPNELGQIDAGINSLRTQLNESRNGSGSMYKATEIQFRLRDLAAQVNETICKAEEAALLETTCAAVASLGYVVERRGEAVRATRGRICLWARTTPWAELSLDFSGFSGLECLREKTVVETELEKRGLTLRKTGSHLHTNIEGGALARALSPYFLSVKGCASKKAIRKPGQHILKQGG